ncbi:conserved phage C-terminal domain-containing protein [Sporosarcina ureae]|uniref:conserved phage C-terminal domain-containing protein n=1 Tax=Sporosarcina ureae TaxID=1571 RepID=UPI000A17C1BB|nr:conserved phage C-terminal domain-containing protein [Sporosarcina ureae]ARK20345.1 hypothetical protein SporoP32a_01545 [Sporosarcina ureae]
MKLLIEEETIPLLPSLVHEVGINGALFLQQLHFRSLVSKNSKDGHKWVYKTYVDWTKEFTFWSTNTIRRIVYDLENKGYLISTDQHNQMKIDKTKWYRIDYTLFPGNPFGIGQIDCPTPPAARVDVEQLQVSELGKPITKELKEPLIIKNKKSVEMNLDVLHSVIEYLNNKTGKQFKTENVTTRKCINDRLSEGYTQEDFIRVIDLKTNQWLHLPEFNQYLRPATLFSASNFENYVNEQTLSKKPKRRPLVPPVLDFTKGDDHV